MTLRKPGRSRKWPQLVYDLDIPGERRRKAVTLKCSLQAAEKEYQRVLDAVADRPYAADHLPEYRMEAQQGLDYTRFAELYLAQVHQDRSEATFLIKNYAFKKFYASVIRGPRRSDLPVGDITPYEVDLFIQKLQSSLTKDGRIYSASSINTYLRHLRAGFSWLLDRGYIQSNPFDGKKVQVQKRGKADKAPYFTDQQVRKILDHLQQDKNRPSWHLAAARFSLLTGCRVGGILNANVNKLFQDAEGSWFIELEEKGSKTRDIPLPREAVELIRERKAEMLHPVEVVWRNAPGVLLPPTLTAQDKDTSSLK